MSAKKAGGDGTPSEAAVDPPFDLVTIAAGLALEHRAYAAGVGRAMAMAAENAVSQQQTNDSIAATVTGKSVNRILTGPLAGLVPGPDDNLERDPHSQKES